MFYLHSSADHAFILSRQSPSKIDQASYSFSGSDQPVSWESVRMVKQLVPLNMSQPDEEPTCPICLSDFTCARITKCGHVFCLPCVLRHSHTSAANNPYQHVKCPCCGIPIVMADLRPVLFQSLMPPTLFKPLKLVKLVRHKDCAAPYLPLPRAPKHCNPHTAPCNSDADAPYCRFSYVDPYVYHASLVANQGQIEAERKGLPPTCTEFTFLSMALEICLHQQSQAQQELEQEMVLKERFETPTSGMYQPQSLALLYTPKPPRQEQPHIVEEASSYEQVAGQEEEFVEEISSVARSRGDSIGSHVSHGSNSEAGVHHQRYRGDSIGSQHSVESSSTSNNNNNARKSPRGRRQCHEPKRLPASMYSEEGAVHFYQAEDGQLVFLNGFNMTCLLTDFAKNLPGETEVVQSPLPDILEGAVVEMETMHLTAEVRKRMPFLSHLPLYTDIVLVELDLHHVLSEATKQKFKADLAKRKKKRQGKFYAEKREDREREKEELNRIHELKARFKEIDPNDAFFRVSEAAPPSEPQLSGDDFGPSVSRQSADTPGSPVPQPAAPAIDFSRAARRGNGGFVPTHNEAFPALGGFPALGATQSTKRTTPASGWGSKPTWEAPSSKVTPPPQASPVANLPPGGKKKKKGRGQKLVLLSTGGQRPSAF